MPSPHSPAEDLSALGKALAQAREARGLERSILARQVALSTQQVQELEEGGMSGFYTESHKRLAARKVAAFLRVDWPPPPGG